MKYVPGKDIEETKRELGLKSVIKLASNENPLKPPREITGIIKKNLDKIKLYPDASYKLLKEAISRKYKVDSASIALGNGADEIIDNIFKMVLSPGKTIIIPEVSFQIYSILGEIYRMKIVRVKLLDYRIDLKAMAKNIDSNTRIIIICNPNNPTGLLIGEEELLDFLKKVPKNCFVALDEAYIDFSDPKTAPDMKKYLQRYRNLILLRTFSKIAGLAGLRIGFAFADKKVAQKLESIRIPFNINYPGYLAAKRSLADDKFRQKTLLNNEKGKRFLYDALDCIGLNYMNTEANFIMFDAEKDDRQVFMEFLKAGIIIRPLSDFGLKNHIRVTIGTPRQNRKFVKALKAICR
jgi:histidinol-phosphate aminotransferase